MDLIAHLTRLFTYDAWANREVLSVLRLQAAPQPRALELMAHILASQRLWMARLQHEPPAVPVWPGLTAEECEKQAAELSPLWRNYLTSSSEEDLALTVTYQNSRAKPGAAAKTTS